MLDNKLISNILSSNQQPVTSKWRIWHESYITEG